VVQDLPGEAYAALKPSMATFERPLLLMISSTYKRAGLFFDRFEASFGRDDPAALAVLGSTRQFNPTGPAKWIEAEVAKDPVKNAAEYESSWRSDVERYIDLHALRAVVVEGRYQIAPSLRIGYHAFTDVSGGTGDSFAMCVAHEDRARRVTVIDFLWEKKAPFDPEQATREACDYLKTYKVKTVVGDNYSAAWASTAFQRNGINYRRSEYTKSQLYENLLPSIMAKQVELLDHPEAVGQLYRLERHTTRNGRDIIDHVKGAHDDLSNVIAGAVGARYGPSTRTRVITNWFSDPVVTLDSHDSPAEAEARAKRTAYLNGRDRERRMAVVYR
jgi:hypothetical protein